VRTGGVTHALPDEDPELYEAVLMVLRDREAALERERRARELKDRRDGILG
jgi:hypothetical protein